MALILNIDTSTEDASICLADKEECLYLLKNPHQRDHAAWLHPAIQSALNNCGKNIKDIEAVGITEGPGSYTGLRVGLATAKGLCYALDIPLITVNTLEAMASVATRENTDYICPMIDARRMEVFTALYDKSLVEIVPPCAMILNNNSFFGYLQDKKIVFFGNGKNKFETLTNQKTAIFKNLIFNALHLSALIYGRFVKSEFRALSTAEPLYLKGHHTNFI